VITLILPLLTSTNRVTIVTDTPDHTVLYDADCGFCRWSLAKLLAWDRRGALRPLALQDPEADRLLAAMPAQRRMESWHLILPDGAVRSSGAAAGALLRLLPGGRPLAALLERTPGATERAYRWVADHRGAIGRLLTDGAKRRADARIARESARQTGEPSARSRV
jgi:predicted DCC family thiol-disulfide oxidoreductase YuxK